MKIDQVIIGPVLTEKATKLADNKVYMFHVNEKANKHQIRDALKALYGVSIENVRVMNREGKTRKVGRRMRPVKKKRKKIAYVTVKEGKIALFPQA